uniref:Putative secreted protein n=1 Tax=Ixodes ricinus TaxID=34613 RepID=A0A6B0UGP4_IXORI
MSRRSCTAILASVSGAWASSLGASWWASRNSRTFSWRTGTTRPSQETSDRLLACFSRVCAIRWSSSVAMPTLPCSLMRLRSEMADWSPML